jgi:hypothetical protein
MKVGCVPANAGVGPRGSAATGWGASAFPNEVEAALMALAGAPL